MILLEEKLDRIINQFPDNAHKIRVMQAASILAKRLDLKVAENEAVLHAVAEFAYTFLGAIGFSAANYAARREPRYKDIIMATTFTAISVLIPYIFNILTNITKDNGRRKYQLSINFAAQFGSVIAFISTFNQGISMLGKADNKIDEAKNFLIVSMATVYSMPASFSIIKQALETPIRFYASRKTLPSIDSTTSLISRDQEADASTVLKLFEDHKSIESLYFLIIIFIFCLSSFNAGVKEYLDEKGMANTFAFNCVAAPVSYLFARLINFAYNKITLI